MELWEGAEGCVLPRVHTPFSHKATLGNGGRGKLRERKGRYRYRYRWQHFAIWPGNRTILPKVPRMVGIKLREGIQVYFERS